VDPGKQRFEARVLIDVRVRADIFKNLPIKARKDKKFKGFELKDDTREWMNEWNPKVG
jgi:hypothetical protein